MQIQIQKRDYSPEEYLEIEEKSENKHEYRNGKIIPVAGGTTNHNKIALNFCRKFPLTVKNQPYDVYLGDVRLWILRHRIYTYPDVMVVKGEPIYQGAGTTMITNPILIAEVLSQSTKDYDRSNKFRFYRSIPEFQEYLTIDQSSFYVEQFVKTSEGKWILTEYEGEDAVLSLDSVEFEIPFRELYSRVNFGLGDE